MSLRGEADAILRRIWGYGRVYDDPPSNATDTRLRMGALILGEIRDLHELLQAGENLPEEWDPDTSYRYRHRTFVFPSEFVYPPGMSDERTCLKGCQWIDDRAPVTACTRCHTIRYRKERP